MRTLSILVFTFFLSACGGSSDSEPTPVLQASPPPMPSDAETVVFERENEAPEAGVVESQAADQAPERERPRYWGIAPGDPLPILWEDLMPEGAYEEVLRQQEEYLAAIQRRYQANSSTLADSTPFSEIEEGSDLDYMPQFGSFDVVEDLDGQLIRIPGYVVPFDFDPDQEHAEFLFVPYMGACIHTPPPPPNQIIFVRADPAIKVEDIWTPYWLEGELSAEQNINDLGDAAYTLSLNSLEYYAVPGFGR